MKSDHSVFGNKSGQAWGNVNKGGYLINVEMGDLPDAQYSSCPAQTLACVPWILLKPTSNSE